MAQNTQPSGGQPPTKKKIVEDALNPQRTRNLWSASYFPALPIVVQEFQMGALLPLMLYMARFGHRRGRGRFAETFNKKLEKNTLPATIADVAEGLRLRPQSNLEGFDGEIGTSILGDLLLAWCLENSNHAEGHSAGVKRVYPTHYLASWIDLPADVAHVRGVPEMLTALLAYQDAGEWIESGGKGRFPVNVVFTENPLLRLFARHMAIRGTHGMNLVSDSFLDDEAVSIGIDELLAIRMAQACGTAPLKASGKEKSERIPNRRPLAWRAAEFLREDLASFIENYGHLLPRQTFLQVLESGIGLGLTNLALATARILAEWERTGVVPEARSQSPWPLFVDASQGQDRMLRDLSEASVTECIRCYQRLPVQMMLLRVLDDRARTDRKLHDQLPAATPDALQFINILGEIYKGTHPRADAIHDAFHEDCLRLADGLDAAGETPEIVQRLRSSSENPVLGLAEAICDLMGDGPQRSRFMGLLESVIMSNQPNGLAIKRRVSRQQRGERRSQDLRSIVLNSALLDFLVHCLLPKTSNGKPTRPLSLPDFLALLRERYGLYVDREPPGLAMPQEVLIRNKSYFERRLRDLGLLIGVNDAESMKQLRPRYQVESGDAF